MDNKLTANNLQASLNQRVHLISQLLNSFDLQKLSDNQTNFFLEGQSLSFSELVSSSLELLILEHNLLSEILDELKLLCLESSTSHSIVEFKKQLFIRGFLELEDLTKDQIEVTDYQKEQREKIFSTRLNSFDHSTSHSSSIATDLSIVRQDLGSRLSLTDDHSISNSVTFIQEILNPYITTE